MTITYKGTAIQEGISENTVTVDCDNNIDDEFSAEAVVNIKVRPVITADEYFMSPTTGDDNNIISSLAIICIISGIGLLCIAFFPKKLKA